MPDIDEDYSYLLDFLREVGTVSAGFSGCSALTFQELEAWSRLMKVDLTPFESTALRDMSAVTANILNNPDSACPIKSEQTEYEIAVAKEAAAAASWG